MNTRLPETWLTVWEVDGSDYTVAADNEPSIDAAVTRHIDSAGTRDTLLTLEFTSGCMYRVRASQITSWAISTPETRRRALELEQWEQEEDERIRHELGIWEDAG